MTVEELEEVRSTSTIKFEWKWIDRTSTYLLVFHFIPDGTFNNSRLEIDKNGNMLTLDYSWAPTHVEQGLVSELLSLANALNGLKLERRIALKDKLSEVACSDLSIPCHYWRHGDTEYEPFTHWVTHQQHPLHPLLVKHFSKLIRGS
jgi:hypothetical protein